VKSVELRNAYEWTCDECGRDSFVRGIVVEITDEDRAHMPELGDDVTGDWFAQPEKVTCPHCGTQFKTVEP
jgi:hypothetical protein